MTTTMAPDFSEAIVVVGDVARDQAAMVARLR